MHFFKAFYVFIATSLLMFSCDEPSPAKLGPKESWKTENYLDSNQITFTNTYAFKDGRFAIGASSFLVKGNKETLLCTAKHLLNEAMGISPKVPTSQFNTKLDYWKVYAKSDALFSDTLRVTSMVTKKPNASDIILLKCQSTKGKFLRPLKPRFTKVNSDEVLEVVGYEYGDESGKQKNFKVEMDEYDGGTLIVKSKSKFRAIGMSGSPVLDKSGYVIGVLVGGGMFEGDLYLTVEPLSKVKKYLN